MADFLKMELQGLEELEDKIKEMAKSVEPVKVEPLLLEGAEVIRDAAKGLAPLGPSKRSGKHLRNAIIAKLLPALSTLQPRSALAGVDRKKAPHAWLVEHGSPGRFKIKDKAKASFHYEVGRYFGPMPARPFMRPAIDNNQAKVMKNIIAGLKKLIEESLTQ